MNIYHKSEKHFCRQFEAKAVTDKALQYQDIDAKKTIWYRNEEGELYSVDKTYSIKCQAIALETGNFSFENKLINSRTGEWRVGNFPNCKADYVVISDSENWYFFDRLALHEWMLEHAKSCVRKNISYFRKLDNQKQGRFYDDAENIIVPIHRLEHLVIKKVKHMKRFAKNYKLSEQKF